MLALSPLPERPFRFACRPRGRVESMIAPAARQALSNALCFGELNQLYSRVERGGGAVPFLKSTFDAMGIRYEVPDGHLERIPQKGPLLVVSNHPFGAVDGMVLYLLLSQVRPDVRLMVNQLLSLIPELESIFFPVDVLDPAAAARNLQSMKRSLAWLRDGHCLGVFPAGEVASFNWRHFRVEDPPWDTQIARMVRATKCHVLPVFFEGTNRLRFHIAGLVHPRLRTLLLPREMLARAGDRVRAEVGHPVRWRRLARFERDQDLVRYLRFRCFALSASRGPETTKLLPSSTAEAIVEPTPVERLRRDIEALPEDRCLAKSGSCRVLYAKADEMPSVMREIGRLREVTFRHVGEGTNKSLDIDAADRHYVQLFAWDDEADAVMGAYRLAKSDEVVAQCGVQGLYTHSLFHYGPELLAEIGPALELGRSFVSRDYQNTPQCLFMLWKAIAVFIARHPQYRVLFGPVTISGSYKSLSTHLIIEFLRTNLARKDLRRHVRARHPLCPKKRKKRRNTLRGAVAMVGDIRSLSELVSGIEDDRKPVPALVEHYVRLGGRFVDFSVDRAFNNAVDAFVVVDLLDTDPGTLERYMGTEGAANFIAYHQSACQSARRKVTAEGVGLAVAVA